MNRILAALLAIVAVTASAANAEPISWPQELDAGSGAAVIVYQPQIETFSGNAIEARAAVAVKTPESDNVPVFGAIWMQARLDVRRIRSCVSADDQWHPSGTFLGMSHHHTG